MSSNAGGETRAGLTATEADAAAAVDALPMGVAEGCRLTRDVPRDTALTYADVELPPHRLIDELRREQQAALLSTAPWREP